MNKTGLFLGGLVAGAAIGAALGILFAPRSGKETRDQIEAKIGEMETELMNLKAKTKEKGLELKDEIKNKMVDLERRIEKLVAEYRRTVQSEPNA